MKKKSKTKPDKKAVVRRNVSIIRTTKALTNRNVSLSGRQVSVTTRKTALQKTEDNKSEGKPEKQ